ncbi:integrase core domain-containing protein [Kaistella polysaccharea]|uniref:integrase core domain-containing protein n=1 Tax=Kaistella polysaccharea TaxID=2878534 RepID=UPI001CF48F24|nr:integrase core domain-containing protein [Kaistella polysaccharea]
MRYNSQGLKRDVALAITKISKHQYYYQPKKTKQGRKPSLVTENIDGEKVLNEKVVDEIILLQEDPDTIYGYKKTTTALKMKGYLINKEKTYRLMKKHLLLQEKAKRPQKTFAKYRKLLPEGPLRLLEMDIKMTWIESVQKHAYTLTLIDTYTRVILHRITKYSIKKNDVKLFWDHVIQEYLQAHNCLKEKIQIEVRNDNDKRFSATLIQEYFKENHLNQVFTHPYTPQESGHIKSFHNILGRHLQPYLFWDLQELENNLELFYEKYNTRRLHSSVADLPPMAFWDLHEKNLIEKTVDEVNRKKKFKLKIPYHEVAKHTGNNEPEGSSLPQNEHVKIYKKRDGAEYFSQHTV